MSVLSLPLSVVLTALERRLAEWVAAPVRPALVRARLADALREEDVAPPLPAPLDTIAPQDEESWRRLAWFVACLDDDDVRDAVAGSCEPEDDGAAWASAAFYRMASDHPLHTMELLARSEHRREELARVWLLRLGISVEGERVQESMERLDRLDYARLRDEVQRAKDNAEERAGYLRKLQEKADRLLSPRGKW